MCVYKKIIFCFSMIIFMISSVRSEELSNLALYIRCHRSITQTFPDLNSPVARSITNNEVNAIDVCIDILKKGIFDTQTSNGRQIASVSDDNSLNVLKTFQSLHLSWFENKTLTSFSEDIIDVGSPALFYTRALFTPDFQFKDIFRNSINLESNRLHGEPNNAAFSGISRADYAPATPEFPFLEVGPLIGYKTYGPQVYKSYHDEYKSDVNIYLGTNWGGGILGSFSYMMMNNLEIRHYQSNGEAIVPRNWAQHVVNDFLCRELPVVRYEDGTTFLSSEDSSISFRKEKACIRCHVTMDRMSGVIRNIKPESDAVSAANRIIGFLHLSRWSTYVQGNETWSLTPDPTFHLKPTTGHFLFRSYDGTKIDQALSNVDSLGSVFGNIDDSYACVAKRYYKYFTGIDINLDDINDPLYPRKLSAVELAHRNEVIELGQKLKQHQSLIKLVEEILRKPQYKKFSFELSQ